LLCLHFTNGIVKKLAICIVGKMLLWSTNDNEPHYGVVPTDHTC